MRKNTIISSITAAIVMITLAGCSDGSVTKESTNGKSVSTETDTIAQFISPNADYYNNGVVYGSDKAMFLDFDTMEKAPLCAVPNCTHSDSSCLANMVGNTPVFFQDSIYFFTSNYGDVKETSEGSEFYMDSKLMKVSLDSSEAETVCEFYDCTPPESENGNYVLYRNELYFVGDDQNPTENAYGGMGWGNTGGTHFLCSINLDTGEYTNYGSIYDEDKEYEAAAYSSQAVISGVYNGKMYLGYTFIKDVDSLDEGNYTFTYLNFEFDFETKELQESNLPYSHYMNAETYTYFDQDDKKTHVIYKSEEVALSFDYEITVCSELNGKLFLPGAGKWFDLIEGTEYSLGKYSEYRAVAYTDDGYVLTNGGRAVKLTEEELLSL